MCVWIDVVDVCACQRNRWVFLKASTSRVWIRSPGANIPLCKHTHCPWRNGGKSWELLLVRFVSVVATKAKSNRKLFKCLKGLTWTTLSVTHTINLAIPLLSLIIHHVTKFEFCYSFAIFPSWYTVPLRIKRFVILEQFLPFLKILLDVDKQNWHLKAKNALKMSVWFFCRKNFEQSLGLVN